MPKSIPNPRLLFKSNRGILGLDEGLERVKDRFSTAKFHFSRHNQRKYLELMITASDLAKYIQGITLTDQTVQMLDSNADMFAKLVLDHKFLLGVRADLGYDRSSLLSREVVTRGLIGLSKRLEMYQTLGASYVVWRNKYYITSRTPNKHIIELNNQETLDFTIEALKNKLIPVVQVKISTNGMQTAEACQEVLAFILEDLFNRMEIIGIDPSHIVLQTNFVTSGRHSKTNVSPGIVASKTAKLLVITVPPSIGGISFVGDGLKSGFGRVYLELLRQAIKKEDFSFPILYSFGRGLHDSAMSSWGGKKDSVVDAQISLVQNSRLDFLANS